MAAFVPEVTKNDVIGQLMVGMKDSDEMLSGLSNLVDEMAAAIRDGDVAYQQYLVEQWDPTE